MLSEKDVQKSSGEHLWNAFTYSITPALFGATKKGGGTADGGGGETQKADEGALARIFR